MRVMGKNLDQISYALGVCLVLLSGCVEGSTGALLEGSRSTGNQQTSGGAGPGGGGPGSSCRTASLVGAGGGEIAVGGEGGLCSSLSGGPDETAATIDGSEASLLAMVAIDAQEEVLDKDLDIDLLDAGLTCAESLGLDSSAIVEVALLGDQIALRLAGEDQAIVAHYDASTGICTIP